MSQKEWEAVVQLAGLVLVVGWLIYDGLAGGFGELSFASVAMRLVWAVVATVVFNIVGIIVVMIGIGIVTRGSRWTRRRMSAISRLAPGRCATPEG